MSARMTFVAILRAPSGRAAGTRSTHSTFPTLTNSRVMNRRLVSRKDLHESALAGFALAQDPLDRAGWYGHRDPVIGSDGAEALADVGQSDFQWPLLFILTSTSTLVTVLAMERRRPVRFARLRTWARSTTIGALLTQKGETAKPPLLPDAKFVQALCSIQKRFARPSLRAVAVGTRPAGRWPPPRRRGRRCRSAG